MLKNSGSYLGGLQDWNRGLSYCRLHTLCYSRTKTYLTFWFFLGYVTIPRRPRVPSWSSAPPSTPLIGEPVYDNLGLRTTAEGSSILSLNKIGETTPRPRPPAGYPQTPQTPVHDDTRLQRSTQSLLSPDSKENWVRIAPEGSSNKPNDSIISDTRRLSSASLASVPEGKKVPPRPPPKPKKSVSTGPLFEDEGEDGTEVWGWLNELLTTVLIAAM